jgi:hypothetical protein
LLGTELKIYAMDWVGSEIYRFGKLDKCLLPVEEDDSKILEDAYCILKLLEVSYYIRFYYYIVVICINHKINVIKITRIRENN